MAPDITGGAVSTTVTTRPAETPTLPAASRATAVSVRTPGDTVVVSQSSVYGAAVTSAPTSTPSTRNRTPATPTSSVAVAATVTRPVRLAAALGVVRETDGGVMSGAAAVVKVTSVDTPRLPAASRERRRTW